MRSDAEYDDLHQKFVDELNRQIQFNQRAIDWCCFGIKCLNMLLFIAFIALTLVIEYYLVLKT